MVKSERHIFAGDPTHLYLLVICNIKIHIIYIYIYILTNVV
jgi:hypothetical protein